MAREWRLGVESQQAKRHLASGKFKTVLAEFVLISLHTSNAYMSNMYTSYMHRGVSQHGTRVLDVFTGLSLNGHPAGCYASHRLQPSAEQVSGFQVHSGRYWAPYGI